VSTAIAAAIQDGIRVGIIVLTNAGSKEEPILNIVYKAGDKAFWLWRSLILPANQTTISRRFKLPRHAGVTTRGDDGAPDVDLTGTYYNAGYGAAELCSAYGSSPSCVSVLDDLRSTDMHFRRWHPLRQRNSWLKMRKLLDLAGI